MCSISVGVVVGCGQEQENAESRPLGSDCSPLCNSLYLSNSVPTDLRNLLIALVHKGCPGIANHISAPGKRERFRRLGKRGVAFVHQGHL